MNHTKRRAFLIHTRSSGSDTYEFAGVFPDRQPNFVDLLAQNGRAWTEERLVSRYDLENLMEDEVTDEEWAEYQEARA